MLIKKPFKKGVGPSIAPYYSSAAAIVFSFAFVSSAVDNSSLTTVTYSSLSFGVANTNRILAVYIAARQNAPTTIVSVTIGGISATLVNAGSTTLTSQTTPSATVGAIYQAAVPSGTSGSVVVTYGAAAQRSAVSLYRIVTGTPAATNSGSSANTVNSGNNLSETVPAGGGGFTGIWQPSATSVITWTAGATQDAQANDPGSAGRFSSATTTGTGPVTVSTSGASNGSSMSWASWGP